MNFDTLVIGSGPGGYIAAIRSAQLGKKVALVEKYTQLGGTCLNVGCIPSKALLDSSEHFSQAQHQFAEHGIEVGNLKLDFAKMIDRKRGVVKTTSDGISFLMKKNKIEVYTGTASFKDKNTVVVKPAKGKELELTATNIIIATGSKPVELPFAKNDGKRIISSTEALELNEVPKHLLIIGGGIIGLELGSVYKRLGAEVSIVEYADSLIPTMDAELGKEIKRILSKEGFNIYLSHKVKNVSAKGSKVTLLADDKNAKEVKLEGDYCLVAVGRKPYTTNLGLEKVGISVNEKGQIPVNQHLETACIGIYAIGDVIPGPMLAHKAEEEGVYVAEVIDGQKPHIHYHLIPGVCYTWPEIASVGYTEKELKEKNIEFKSGKFSFKASGRARASMDTDGFIKVLADKNTDEILGVHMIGPRIADIINEAVVAMEYRASAEDIGRMCHAHPTFAEALKEACLAATDNRSLNT